MTDHYVSMKVTGLTIDPFTNMPIVILKDASEETVLPIWVGLIEASSIATELESINLSRPMTHDLVCDMLQKLSAAVKEVRIVELRDSTFFSNIIISRDGKEFEVDCRPSDALAVALRAGAPILVSPEVVEKSRQIEASKISEEEIKSEKWTEILENLTPADFGKYKM
jgi:bifunctional DNase/RNase